MISIIVPVYNEEKNIIALLEELNKLKGESEILITDGESRDSTLEMLEKSELPLKIVTGAKGRGRQMNNAAELALGEILFFLHSDSKLEDDVLFKITQAIQEGANWGCLKLAFDQESFLLKFTAYMSNRRVTKKQIVFGDQGIFMTRELFQKAGGFPALPIMEDYELSLRLKKLEQRPMQINSTIITSARRFEKNGVLATMLKMQKLRKQYDKGRDIQSILEEYQDIR